MNEKEVMQDMLEFAAWIAQNASNFDFLKNSQGVQMIASAKNEDDVKRGLIQIEQEVNDSNKLKELYSMYKNTKNSQIPKHQSGSKMDYLIRRISELENMPSRHHTTYGGRGYVTEATAGNNRYVLDTDTRDSLMWWTPSGLGQVTLSNSGPNRTWTGYRQEITPNGTTSVQLSPEVTDAVKRHMFDKLGVK